jgi:hypothetical protein
MASSTDMADHVSIFDEQDSDGPPSPACRGHLSSWRRTRPRLPKRPASRLARAARSPAPWQRQSLVILARKNLHLLPRLPAEHDAKSLNDSGPTMVTRALRPSAARLSSASSTPRRGRRALHRISWSRCAHSCVMRVPLGCVPMTRLSACAAPSSGLAVSTLGPKKTLRHSRPDTL